MADELVLKLKIETSGTDKKLEDVNTQMDKIKKNSKETGDSFGFADTKIGKMWSSFTGGAQKGIQAMGTLKGAIAATGIGLLLIAITGLVNWLKKTETGSDLVAKVMKGLGQVIKEGPVAAFNALKLIVEVSLVPIRTAIATFKHMREVLAGRESLKEATQGIKDDIKALGTEIKNTASKFGDMTNNVKDALKLADAWDKLEDKRRDQQVKLKQLESELQNLREKASDTDEKLKDRVLALNQANNVASQQYQLLKKDKETEISLIEEELRLYPDNQEWIEKLAKAKGELWDIDTAYAKDKKMIGKQLNTLEKQQVKDVEDAEKEKQKAKAETDKETQKLLEDQTKKTQEELEKQLALQKEHEDNVLKLKDELALQGLDKGQYYDALRLNQEYENRKRGIEESKLDEEDKLEELSLLWDLYLQKNNELKAQYDDEANAAELEANQKKLDDKEAQEQEVRQALKEGAVQIAQATADAVFSIQQNKLNAAREAELSNKNLTEEQKNAINKKYADKQKKMDLAQAAVNIAMSIMKVFATMGPPISFVMAGITAALGAIQLATIAKTKYYALGGWIRGLSHAQGGVNIGGGNYAEGGEFIVNKRTMENPIMATQVQQLNSAGNTGKQLPPPITADEIINGLTGALKAIPVTVTEHQISKAQSNVYVREQRFTVA